MKEHRRAHHGPAQAGSGPDGGVDILDRGHAVGGQADRLGLNSEMFRLIAGPWMSIEEAKVVFVFETPDAAETLPAYGQLLADGLLAKRRLTQLIEWDEATAFVDGLVG